MCIPAVPHNTNAIAPQTNGSSVPVQLINATQLGFDPRFTIDPEAGPNSIDPIAAYMTTLALLFILAEEDYDSQLTRQSGRLRQWPELMITIRTITRDPLPMAFAIWGLFEAIYYMAEHSLTDGTIYLKWLSLRVGVIDFQLLPSGSLQAAGSTDSFNSTNIPNLEASQCLTVYKPNGQDLPQAGVYLSLASAVVDMAQYGVRGHMPVVWHYLAGYRTAVWVDPEIRTEPPWMSVGSGLSAAWSAAMFVTEEQRYAEFTTSIIASGQELLGRIVVNRDPTPPSVLGPNLAGPQGVATT